MQLQLFFLIHYPSIIIIYTKFQTTIILGVDIIKMYAISIVSAFLELLVLVCKSFKSHLLLNHIYYLR